MRREEVGADKMAEEWCWIRHCSSYRNKYRSGRETSDSRELIYRAI